MGRWGMRGGLEGGWELQGAYLALTLLVEGERVHSVGDRVAYEWDPVEDVRRLGLVSRA